jgi:acyl dehydratase
MRVVGLGTYWNDLRIGEKYRTVGRTIFEADLVNFIGITGMQENLFNNLEYVRDHSPLGRAVPGALVYSFAEGLLITSTIQGVGMAFLNATIDIKGPTLVGDTIHVEVEVQEIKPTSKDPKRALVRTFNEVKNQKGQTVLSYNPLRMVRGKPEAR